MCKGNCKIFIIYFFVYFVIFFYCTKPYVMRFRKSMSFNNPFKQFDNVFVLNWMFDGFLECNLMFVNE